MLRVARFFATLMVNFAVFVALSFIFGLMMLRVIAVVIKHPVSDDGSFFLFDSTVATPVFFAERD